MRQIDDRIPPAEDPDAVRRSIDEILSDAAYDEPTETILERAIDWTGRQIGRGFELLTGGGPGTVVAWLVVGAVAAAVVLAARRRRGDTVAPVPTPAGPVIGTDAAPDPAVWSREADRLRAAGEHKAAIRCRHQQFVAAARRHGVLSTPPGASPRVIAVTVGRAFPPARSDLDQLTTMFEEVWYGGRDVTASDDDVRARLVDGVVHAVSDGPHGDGRVGDSRVGGSQGEPARSQV